MEHIIGYMVLTFSILCWSPCLSLTICMCVASGCCIGGRLSSSFRLVVILYLIASKYVSIDLTLKTIIAHG